MSLGASIPGSSSSSSSSPDGTPADTEVAFTEAVQAAVRERLAREALTPGALLETGEIDPVRLCRYASGRLEGAERADAERMVARSRWAVGRVAALVKAARVARPGPSSGLTLLAKMLLAANPNQLDPNRIAGAALLEEVGSPTLASGPEATVLARLESEQPRVRAAALLALGRADLARPIFGALSETGSPLLQLARKIAHAEDTDRAWAELLSSL